MPLTVLQYKLHFDRGSEFAGPAAGITSTANDMGKWLQFVLAGGVTQDGEQLVSNTSLAVSICGNTLL